jgi:hypothetical protein
MGVPHGKAVLTVRQGGRQEVFVTYSGREGLGAMATRPGNRIQDRGQQDRRDTVEALESLIRESG